MNTMEKFLILSIASCLFLQNSVTGLQCYVCNRQDGNEEKCLNTIKTCDVGEDRCMSVIRWSTTPYWTQGAEKQYYVSKKCATAEECKTTIKETMNLCHYIWYEDWKCAECCVGNRCNYYITLGSSSLKASHLMIAVSLILGLFLLRRDA